MSDNGFKHTGPSVIPSIFSNKDDLLLSEISALRKEVAELRRELTPKSSTLVQGEEVKRTYAGLNHEAAKKAWVDNLANVIRRLCL